METLVFPSILTGTGAPLPAAPAGILGLNSPRPRTGLMPLTAGVPGPLSTGGLAITGDPPLGAGDLPAGDPLPDTLS